MPYLELLDELGRADARGLQTALDLALDRSRSARDEHVLHDDDVGLFHAWTLVMLTILRVPP